MQQLLDTIEYRESIFQTDIESEQVQNVLNLINYARNGYKKYYKLHPDFIKKLEPSAYIGNFPDNVKDIIWWHTGFEGSLGLNSLPRSNWLEVHGILKLSTEVYLGFSYCEKDETFIGVCSKSIRSILKEFSSEFYDKYIDETESMEHNFDFIPNCDDFGTNLEKKSCVLSEDNGWDQLENEFGVTTNVEYRSFLEKDFNENSLHSDEESSINDRNILINRSKCRTEFMEALPASPISFISKYD
jgi:hypothetical protein